MPLPDQTACECEAGGLYSHSFIFTLLFSLSILTFTLLYSHSYRAEERQQAETSAGKMPRSAQQSLPAEGAADPAPCPGSVAAELHRTCTRGEERAGTKAPAPLPASRSVRARGAERTKPSSPPHPPLQLLTPGSRGGSTFSLESLSFGYVIFRGGDGLRVRPGVLRLLAREGRVLC